MEWHDLTQQYLLQRKSLAHVFLLIDASHPPHQIDTDCAGWLQDGKVDFSVVFTKADAQQAGSHDSIAAMDHALLQLLGRPVPFVVTSAVTGYGRETLLQYCGQILAQFKMPLRFR